jgi:2-keto-4-pentenoate hydratase/2-oxohepta-3-ene-1,7-dioic acid hydratase in catechol pathway
MNTVVVVGPNGHKRWTLNLLTPCCWVGRQGELVFVTSKEAKNVPISEAKDYILGYTIGNDLSCRLYQINRYSAGQFFFAKAFDKFAPIGPTLISPEIFGDGSSFTVVTKVNGEVRQKAEFTKDLIFSPERILSHMSQGALNLYCSYASPGQIANDLTLLISYLGTTIPAGTAVMTGTPAGVGAFRQPKTFLQDGDVVEVEMKKVGTLRNSIKFE